MNEGRKFLFPWVCRKIGAFFFAEDAAVITVCPICGPDEPNDDNDGQINAFENGHLYRKFAESFFQDERK